MCGESIKNNMSDMQISRTFAKKTPRKHDLTLVSYLIHADLLKEYLIKNYKITLKRK